MLYFLGDVNLINPAPKSATHYLHGLFLKALIGKAVDDRVDAKIHHHHGVRCLIHDAVHKVIVHSKIVQDVVD